MRAQPVVAVLAAAELPPFDGVGGEVVLLALDEVVDDELLHDRACAAERGGLRIPRPVGAVMVDDVAHDSSSATTVAVTGS